MSDITAKVTAIVNEARQKIESRTAKLKNDLVGTETKDSMDIGARYNQDIQALEADAFERIELLIPKKP